MTDAPTAAPTLTVRRRAVFGLAVMAVAAGFGGGMVAGQFHEGPRGDRGRSGERGPVGIEGPRGSVANVDNLGVCWQVTYGTFTNGAGYVSGVNLIEPQLSAAGATQSCPAGYFVGVKAVRY